MYLLGESKNVSVIVQYMKSFKHLSFTAGYTLCSNLEYLITVHNGKLDFKWLAKKDNLMLLN